MDPDFFRNTDSNWRIAACTSRLSADMDVLMGDVQSDSLGKLMSMDLDDDDLAVLTN